MNYRATNILVPRKIIISKNIELLYILILSFLSFRMLLVEQYNVILCMFTIIDALPHNYFFATEAKDKTKKNLTHDDGHLVEKEGDHSFIDPNVIKDGIHYACHGHDCFKIRKFRLPPVNDYDCEEDTILISFKKIVENKTIKQRGYLLPYASNNEVILHRRFSDTCRLIKR